MQFWPELPLNETLKSRDIVLEIIESADDQAVVIIVTSHAS